MGEDDRYIIQEQETGFRTVQAARLRPSTDRSFEAFADDVTKTTEEFFSRPEIPQTTQPLRIPNNTSLPLVLENFARTDVCQLWVDEADKSVVICFNHAKVGGGDFLQWYTNTCHGTSNSLIPEAGRLQTILCMIRSTMWYFTGPMAPWRSGAALRECSLRKDAIKFFYTIKHPVKQDGASAKMILIHGILSDIFRGYSTDVVELSCWIPVAFVKDDSSPYNNIGVIPFVAEREDTARKLQDKINRNGHCAVSSNTLLRYWTGKSYSSSSSTLRKKVDVVLTLGNLTAEDPTCLSNGYGGFLFQETPFAYPVYVFGITINGRSQVSYTISDQRLDASKVINEDVVAVKDPFFTGL